MKKILPALLVLALGAELAAVAVLLGGCVSPRQAFYTITDAVMNSIYRFRQGWQARISAP